MYRQVKTDKKKNRMFGNEKMKLWLDIWEKTEGCFMPHLLGIECTLLADGNTGNCEKKSVKKVIAVARAH